MSTLAHHLGTTTHISPLLQKARRLGLRTPHDLERLAVQRGCDYYARGGEEESESIGQDALSNEELAGALLNLALEWDPQSIRVGAAMLGAEGNEPYLLARIGVMERGEQVFRYVAEAGQRYEPNNAFWSELIRLLPKTPPPKEGVLPHPARFVAMTGMTRRGREVVAEWIRPNSTPNG